MNLFKFFKWYFFDQFTLHFGGGDGGGGGGGQQNTSTSYQTNIPEYARPYVETMLAGTQKQLFQTQPTEGGGTEITGFQPYRAYGGTYDESGKQTAYDPSKGIAGFQPMQTRAQEGIAGMQMPGEYGQASGATQQAMQNLQGMGYQGGNFGNQFRTPGAYQAGQFSMGQAQAPELQNYQMQGPQDVQAQQFGQQAAEQYMSPYMQSVVEKQQREAQRTADIAGTQRGAQAVGAGAFGGSRQAIMDAEAARNLALQKGDIQAQGLQSAFGQAQQQYNADQQQRMQAALANQGMGYNVGSQNLAANLGIQQLGAGQNLQAQLANQQALMAAQQAQEQSRQYGAGLGMTAAQQRAQYGLAGQQLGEQSRQYGANYGLQANQAALGAANQLAGIGGQRLQAQQGIYGLQNQMGAQQQALEQQKLNQAMQDYANAQQYPLMQLGTMSNMIRGLPMQASTSNQYMAQPNTLTQAIGAAGTGYGLYNAFAPKGASGGLPSEFKKSGIMSYRVGGEIESDLENMDEQGLQKQLKESSSPSIKRMAQRILRERQMEKGPGMAGGGIIAFKEPTEENNQSLVEEKPTSSQMLQQRVMQGKPTGDVTTQPAGILQAAPTPPPPPAPANMTEAVQAAPDLTPAMKAAQKQYAADAAIPMEERLAKIQEAKKAAGIEAPGIEQRAKLMAERANAEDEAERTRSLRLAEFFATWGSTPGNTLVAGMASFKEKVPSIISDEKEAKKIRMEIDKSIASLDEATRLENKGDFEAATAEKNKAAEMAKAINLEIIKIQEAEAAGERKDKRADKAAIAAAEKSREHDIRVENMRKDLQTSVNETTLAAEKIRHSAAREGKEAQNKTNQLSKLNAATALQSNVEAKIANEIAKGDYQNLVTESTMTGEGELVKARAAAAKAELAKIHKSHEKMRQTAETTLDFVKQEIGMTSPTPAPTTLGNRPVPKGAVARGAPTRPSLDDPSLQR